MEASTRANSRAVARRPRPAADGAAPRLTASLRDSIRDDAVAFIAERYSLDAVQRTELAAIPIRWRRGCGASAYYPRRAHGFAGPHILLRFPPAARAQWHTYRRARARFSTPAGGIALDAPVLATAVLVHELTHALQHGACGHVRRKFSEVETTENEIEFVRRRSPEAFAQLVPVVRRAPRRAARAAAKLTGLAALRAIVLRAAGTLAGLIQPRPGAAPRPQPSRPRARSPRPTGN